MQNFDHNIVFFLEKRQFFAENWRKSQKSVIITSTPGVSVTIFKMFSQNVKNRFRKWRFLLKTLCMKITEK
jgi:hypothetical protein